MSVSDLPLLSVLRERMSWLNQRQAVLSQNVANADAPGYSAIDLKAPDFDALLKNNARNQTYSGSMLATDPRHFSINASGQDGFEQTEAPDAEASRSGNTVSLEEEMIKVADTQAQYQAAANLYSKAMNLLRTAIGKGGA